MLLRTFLGVRHHCNYRLKVTAGRLHEASHGDTQKEEQWVNWHGNAGLGGFSCRQEAGSSMTRRPLSRNTKMLRGWTVAKRPVRVSDKKKEGNSCQGWRVLHIRWDARRSPSGVGEMTGKSSGIRSYSHAKGRVLCPRAHTALGRGYIWIDTALFYRTLYLVITFLFWDIRTFLKAKKATNLLCRGKRHIFIFT